MSQQYDLTQIPDYVLKHHLLERPSDPRYSEAVKESGRRGIIPNTVIIPDHIIEYLLCAPECEGMIGEENGSFITWIRKKAAQALGRVRPGKKSEDIPMSGINWRFREICGRWALDNVEILDWDQ